jgi:aspartyl-tRNA(Asn)/glutamyl-tRNA(Gln) amidotransferase subunit B
MFDRHPGFLMFEAVIGLEVHAQLRTRTKLFCACPRVDEDAVYLPNSAICPICTGHPGTLPNLNRAAVQRALLAATALGATVHRRSSFVRKHYDYPDLPKGYQITQGDAPIATGGAVQFTLPGDAEAHPRSIALDRIQLEEDTGKSTHTTNGWRLDFNRAGTPLLEIVTTPTIRSARDAEACLRSLHQTLTLSGACLGDLERGNFRVDANVSIRAPTTVTPARVEIKNLNSFRFVARALQHEIDRQIRVLRAGGEVLPETRGWRGGVTVPLRAKASPENYRYLPELDLPDLVVIDVDLDDAARGVPDEAYATRRIGLANRQLYGFRDRYALTNEPARALLSAPDARSLFEAAVSLGGDPTDIANWLIGEGLRHANLAEGPCRLSAAALVALSEATRQRHISRSEAKHLFSHLWHQGGDVPTALGAPVTATWTDPASLGALVRAVIADNPAQVKKYRQGNPKVVGYFVGQVLRATGGRADPAIAQRAVAEELDRV